MSRRMTSTLVPGERVLSVVPETVLGMNWADVVDTVADLLPRGHKRAAAWILAVLILIPGHPGVTLLMAYAQARADAIVHSIVEVTSQLAPVPTPAPTPTN